VCSWRRGDADGQPATIPIEVPDAKDEAEHAEVETLPETTAAEWAMTVDDPADAAAVAEVSDADQALERAAAAAQSVEHSPPPSTSQQQNGSQSP
jgi:hypothetical protein